ncbi:NAD(P) transhydrogenase subunit alpha [Kitasatospora sp. NBC_00240]|uniref:NAD(P) transhydrogenase subunit alpha n=1 Tax=Kitasatospora sp. NBC_00240 TaxID=2903567 RepID=UPI00225979D6|nr:NAD(P) transhydrogenase subunit alpha [Kitasatospora sp. NBC_00240]MCX5208223.1 NAD(P) transhydrogenase subunit alpha [Kitasatospora sp. NBC_00240]
MTITAVGVLRETTPGERRVALVPELVPAVGRLGMRVLVEPGAGALVGYHDADYRAAGATVVGRTEVLRHADVLLGVHPPNVDPVRALRPGQVLAAMLRPLRIPYLVRQWADRGVTAIGLDLAPDLPAAYPLDAEASQARVAGYRAVLVAAGRLSRCLPPWGTADGFFDPVRVLVVGAGHAGLQAIDTARRLGAPVDVVEPRQRERVAAAALGAHLVDLPELRPVVDDRAQLEAVDSKRPAWAAGVAEAAARCDIVVTALVMPGVRPPVLFRTVTVARLRPGSVLVDLASGPEGGNIEGSLPDTTTLVGDGVTVIGAGEFAAQVPETASHAYAHNALALVDRLSHTRSLAGDPVFGPMLVTDRGAVRHGPTGLLLAEVLAAAGLP